MEKIDNSAGASLDIEAAAKNVTLNLLPLKSRRIYEKTYDEFVKWCEVKEVKAVSEDVLLVYFDEQSKVYKPTSLWSRYSMIRANLTLKENIDISQFKRLFAFLKRQSEGYKPEKAKILKKEQITKFFLEAPDDTFLMMKVAITMGIFGACRRMELTQLTLDDVEDVGSALIVKVRKTKTKIDRTFTVVNNEEENLDFLRIFRKYMSLRPSHTEHRRLFIHYKNGKCTSQPVGKNTLGGVPQTVAKFLKLPNASAYTGHCFRRSSATLLADGGADLTHIKRLGGWRSSTIAESYIEDSVDNKIKTAKVLIGKDNAACSSSTSVNVHSNVTRNINAALLHSIPSAFNISNCNNCKIDVNVHVNK